MSRLDDLYELAGSENIQVYCFALPLTQSISLIDENGNGTVAIDPFALETTADETVHLAHELGHCITGSFYNRFSDCDVRAKAEYRADKWATKKLVPFDELKQAFFNGITEVWELAEYFNVTEDFMRKALEVYQDDILSLEVSQ